MFAIKEKTNHDSMWMKFTREGREIKLYISRRGESIKYFPADREIAKQIWGDFQAMKNGSFADAFKALRKKYEMKK